MTPRSSTLQILLAGLAFVWGGCASVDSRPTGFLDRAGQDAPVAAANQSFRYCDSAALPAYRAVLIEPVTLQPNALAKLSAGEQAELSRRLTEQVQTTLAARFTVTAEVQPDVLRLRTAVADLNKSSRAINVVTAAVAFVPMDAGAVAVEMEAVDAVSGARVAALRVSRQGNPISPAGFFASFSPTGHAEAGFKRATEELLELLTVRDVPASVQPSDS